jgi:ferredoxin
MKHKVTIEETGETYGCSQEESVLCGMEKLGRKGIPVGCRGGGCGVCKVEVVDGRYRSQVMSREHVSVDDEAHGRVLACRIRPSTDLRLRVLGQMKKHVCSLSGYRKGS